MRKIDLPLVQRIALTMAIAIMVACSWLAPIDSAANNQIDAGFKRALISFATARLLNAGLSFVETTEISATPMGVGVKFAPGQVLKPVNDMVEQFAHLMLIASVAFGVEKMLISFGSYWLVSLFLTATAIGWAYLNYKKQHSPAWISRILVVLLMIRFAIPIAVIGSDALADVDRPYDEFCVHKMRLLEEITHCRYRWSAPQYSNTAEKRALRVEMDEQV